MSSTALDVPAINSSVPTSVRTTNVLVTSSESIDKVRLGDDDGEVAGTTFTDADDEAVPGYTVGFIDNVIPVECDVDRDNDDDEALEDIGVGGFICK